MSWLEWREQLREDGSIRSYVAARDGAPEWIQELIYAAHDHGRWLPDDHVYEAVYRILEALAREASEDDVHLEPPVTYEELLAWLTDGAGAIEAVDYVLDEIVDYVLDEIPVSRQGLWTLLAAAWGEWAEEIKERVVESLQD
ncbi:MAG: hypothetical protein KM310_06995 [Clostridiales bacterium]|nr:hypothetical protein [Clostridiales bacterium]